MVHTNNSSLPRRMARLPRDKHDRPIPWFVHIDPDTGTPDFRVIRRSGIEDAHRFGWCWVCGQLCGQYGSFVLGPMCGINRTSAEPPSHLDCATYSAEMCPFLSTPSMTRRDRSLPVDRADPAGVSIWRNPGVALVWTTRKWTRFRVPAVPGATAGYLFELGDPVGVAWYAHGRSATRDEVQASIDSGWPQLMQAAEQDGPAAVAELEQRLAATLDLLPAGADTP